MIALPQLPTYQEHVGTLLGGYGTAFEFVTITTSNKTLKLTGCLAKLSANFRIGETLFQAETVRGRGILAR